VRLGNWLTADQGRRLLECQTPSTARELRDHANLRPSVPPRGRRTRPDPVPARPRVHPDDGALPRMQTEAPYCRERPVGNRT
jgi:hypothetical protein